MVNFVDNPLCGCGQLVRVALEGEKGTCGDLTFYSDLRTDP